MQVDDQPTRATLETPPSTLGAEDILDILLREKDAEKAVRLTIARNPTNAYSFYKYCRQKLVRNDAHRDPQYLSRVRHFQHVYFSPQDPEWELLNRLMEAPLHTQYRVERERQPYLPRHDQELKSIRSMPPAFYEYRMPLEIVDAATQRMQERREERHARGVTIRDIQSVVSKARNWREFKHPWELVACASILCGRRTQEITHSMEFEKASEYQIDVCGLLKQRVGAGRIPLLCTADDFEELMSKIREHDLPTESSTHRLKPACLRVFGEWFNHAERRNIYCEAAWRTREQNGFHPSMAKIMWFDKALCHDVNVVVQAPSLIYQSLQFDE